MSAHTVRFYNGLGFTKEEQGLILFQNQLKPEKYGVTH